MSCMGLLLVQKQFCYKNIISINIYHVLWFFTFKGCHYVLENGHAKHFKLKLLSSIRIKSLFLIHRYFSILALMKIINYTCHWFVQLYPILFWFLLSATRLFLHLSDMNILMLTSLWSQTDTDFIVNGILCKRNQLNTLRCV